MHLIFTAVGSPEKPASFIAANALINAVAILVYSILRHANIDFTIALVGFFIVIFISIRMRKKVVPQQLSVICKDGEKIELFGKFVEGDLPLSKAALVASAERTEQGIQIKTTDSMQGAVYSLDGKSFTKESLDDIGSILNAIISKSDIQSIGNVKVSKGEKRTYIRLWEKPSYVMLSWLSFAIGFGTLYAAIKFIQP